MQRYACIYLPIYNYVYNEFNVTYLIHLKLIIQCIMQNMHVSICLYKLCIQYILLNIIKCDFIKHLTNRTEVKKYIKLHIYIKQLT